MIKDKVKALWKLCFNENNEFIEMYFRLRYNNEVNIAIKSGEEVVAALQLLPYPMTFCGGTIQTSYISGACTHPDYRGNGVMRELLAQAFVRMLRNGTHISTIIPAEPWLFGYYARMGYAPVFNNSVQTRCIKRGTSSASITLRRTTEYEEEVYQYLNKALQKRPCCIQHTAADFKVILADLSIAHDALYIALQEDKVAGVAIAYHKKGSLFVSELLANNKEIEKELLYQIGQTARCKHITVATPPQDSSTSRPIGMARIITPRPILKLYAAIYPEEELNIELADEQLSTNNGYYYLCSGKCMFNKERLPGAHVQMTIGELSQRILAPLQPYMSLMMD